MWSYPKSKKIIDWDLDERNPAGTSEKWAWILKSYVYARLEYVSIPQAYALLQTFN